jgi:hypothetical protein
MKTNKVTIIAKAYYNGELVDVLDMIVRYSKKSNAEYLINYGGPVWVMDYELSGVVWVA